MFLLLAALQTIPVQQFPRASAPGVLRTELRSAVDRACNNSSGQNRAALLQREDALAAKAHDAHAPASDWVALGCVRAALDGDGAMARPGLLMVAGNSWGHGAERALLQALDVEPGNIRAAEVLGMLAMDDLEPDDTRATAAAIVKAVNAGGKSGPLLRACSELAVRLKDAVTGRKCANAALVAGMDSTWQNIRLSRISFREGDTTQGMKRFLVAMASAHDSVAKNEIAWHLQWFLSPTEQKESAALSDTARSRWVRDRLSERDIRDGRAPGARLAEHFDRLDYVLEHFRLSLSRIARDGSGLKAVSPVNSYPADTVRSFCEPGLVPAIPFRDYSSWQDRVDDRGVVWLRFGEPTKRVQATPTCDSTIWDYDPSPDSHKPKILATNVREIWVYEIDGQTMLLNFEAEKFSGSVEATRLVTGVLGSYMCGVDTRRCLLTNQSIAAAKAGGRPINPEDIEHIRQDDREYISVATTKDDNSPRGDKVVPIVSRLSRLWDPVSGAPISLVTYAVPVKDLAIVKQGEARTTVLALELRQWDPASGRNRDTSFTRNFNVPDTSLKRPNLVGFVVVPSSPTTSAWSLVATQSDHRRGRAYDVTTGGLGDGSLVMSDVVLGAEAQGLTWNFHNVEIPLAPTTVLDHKQPVSLYYQIRSREAHTDLRTSVALFSIEKGIARDTASFQVAFEQAVNAGLNEIAPSMDISRLEKGHYRMDVRITTSTGEFLSARSVILDIE